jgi:hypothetical protein
MRPTAPTASRDGKLGELEVKVGFVRFTLEVAAVDDVDSCGVTVT